eukprot:Hpha_TRINITY_DN14982_c4_g16::TRINITY_DN14982_c4_g16_i1::g.143393::m.143393/K17292/TBCA; tubulin-specific chaperone A
MSTDPQVKKNLSVKSGTLKRNLKDLAYALKEVAQEEGRLEKVQSEGADEFRQKQQRQVVDEAKAMVPDARQRIARSAADLKQLLEQEQIEEDLAEAKKEAETMLEEAEKASREA